MNTCKTISKQRTLTPFVITSIQKTPRGPGAPKERIGWRAWTLEGVFDYGAVLAAFPFVACFAELQGVGGGGRFTESAFGGVQIVRDDTEAEENGVVHFGDAGAQAFEVARGLRGAGVYGWLNFGGNVKALRFVEAGHQEIDSQITGLDGVLLLPLQVFRQNFAQPLRFQAAQKDFDQ